MRSWSASERNTVGKPISAVRISPAAERDLNRIWDYTAAIWSPAQADRYLRSLWDVVDALQAHPGIAPERQEFRPPVRLFTYRAHLIVYRVEQDTVAILRVLHCRQNWRSILRN